MAGTRASRFVLDAFYVVSASVGEPRGSSFSLTHDLDTMRDPVSDVTITIQVPAEYAFEIVRAGFEGRLVVAAEGDVCGHL